MITARMVIENECGPDLFVEKCTNQPQGTVVLRCGEKTIARVDSKALAKALLIIATMEEL